jgi:hypothetical protein
MKKNRRQVQKPWKTPIDFQNLDARPSANTIANFHPLREIVVDTARSLGYRQLTILMIVIAPWILDRYRSSKQLEGMAGSGFYLGFIIALYAEIYGFPLTISSQA